MTLGKYIFLLVGLCLLAVPSKACDWCGCGGGLINPSVLPQFHNNFIGLNYSRLSFYYPEYETIDEMQSIELQMRYYLGPKIQVLGSLPIRQLDRTGSNGNPSLRGIGDACLSLNIQSSYQKSLSSIRGYFLGDQARYALMVFGRKSFGMSTLMPSTGLEWEWLGRDVEDRFFVNQSGGSGLFLMAGLDWFSSSVVLGFSYRHPIAQAYAQNEIESRSRWGIRVSYLF